MKFKIKNCYNEKWTFNIDIENDNSIVAITKEVISGDELINIYKIDGSLEYFDSDRHSRIHSFNDGTQILWVKGIGLIPNNNKDCIRHDYCEELGKWTNIKGE
ncbi:MAG: hypothetical protein EOL97_09830 [Spirochaetia bacterium]|nr:hypothetical protein [Spirochaetia bacterium]